jgi:type IV pilus assembly protein PilQ
MIFGTKNDAEVAQKVITKLDTKPMVNTFRVSHVTPKEMADLLCSTLFSSEGGAAGGNSSSSSGGGEGALSIGGGTIACKVGTASTNGTAVAFKGQVATLVYLDQQGEVTLYGGSYDQAKMVKDFIAKHDVRQPMAYIEMNVIELNETGSNEFSSSWTIDVPFGTFVFDPDSGVEINDVTVFDGDGWKWFVGDQTSKAVTTLKWLLKDGKGRVLSNPKIMVTNGQTSTIDMTSDYVKTVTTEFTQSTTGLSSTPITTRTYEIGDDNGFKIDLTPFISPEGYVTLNLTPDFATIKEKVYTKAVDETTGETYDDLAATLLQRRNLELKNIRIKDGETLILAGYVQEEETQTVSKMPFLGDLPLVGVFFRRTANSKTRSELVITG